MSGYEEIISKKDLLDILDTTSDCLRCSSATDINDIMSSFGELIDFRYAIYGLATLDRNGTIVKYDTINLSYPSEWLELYKANELHRLDPIAKENFLSYDLQYWADTYKKDPSSLAFSSVAGEFNLSDGYTYGVANSSRTEGCIFSIAGMVQKHSRTEFILNRLVPHFHQAFSAVLSAPKMKSRLAVSLSNREREILNWVKNGKSSWEVSAILAISERTVKFHVDNIMKKLDAVSRTHAVAVALSAGLIDIE